jgi:hypothetical protein
MIPIYGSYFMYQPVHHPCSKGSTGGQNKTAGFVWKFVLFLPFRRRFFGVVADHHKGERVLSCDGTKAGDELEGTWVISPESCSALPGAAS